MYHFIVLVVLSTLCVISGPPPFAYNKGAYFWPYNMQILMVFLIYLRVKKGPSTPFTLKYIAKIPFTDLCILCLNTGRITLIAPVRLSRLGEYVMIIIIVIIIIIITRHQKTSDLNGTVLF